MKWIIAFVAMFVLDFIWAKYTIAIEKRWAYTAGFTAVGIMLCNSIVTLGYVSDPWMILPTAAGALCGTVVAVKRSPS